MEEPYLEMWREDVIDATLILLPPIIPTCISATAGIAINPHSPPTRRLLT